VTGRQEDSNGRNPRQQIFADRCRRRRGPWRSSGSIHRHRRTSLHRFTADTRQYRNNVGNSSQTSDGLCPNHSPLIRAPAGTGLEWFHWWSNQVHVRYGRFAILHKHVVTSGKRYKIHTWLHIKQGDCYRWPVELHTIPRPLPSAPNTLNSTKRDLDSNPNFRHYPDLDICRIAPSLVKGGRWLYEKC